MGKRFTIITPIFVGGDDSQERRLRLFEKNIESIKNQTFRDFEHIIVNDGSTIPLTVPDYPWIRVIDQPNKQRMEAYNEGLRQSTGEIICFLDSDDEYEPGYLYEVDSFFKRWPSYKLFNFGCKFIHKDGNEALRDAFEPKRKKVGHEVFGGGNIVNGTFVFHRSIYDDLGAFPPPEIKGVDCSELNYPAGGSMIRDLNTASPYDFSAAAQLEFPEIQQYFMVKHPDHPKHLVKELGNPFGNDFYLYFKYTRKYHSKAVKEKYLLKVNLK